MCTRQALNYFLVHCYYFTSEINIEQDLIESVHELIIALIVVEFCCHRTAPPYPLKSGRTIISFVYYFVLCI